MSVSVVVDDIKLPLKMAVSGRGRLVTRKRFGEGIYQITSVEEYSPEEVALCEMVVENGRSSACYVVQSGYKIPKGER